MAIVQNKSINTSVSSVSGNVPKGMEDCPYLKANHVQISVGKTHTRAYKKRVMATNPTKLSSFKKEELKEKIKFFLPPEHSNEIYKAGYYTLIRLKRGPVKMFNTNFKEISAKPFIEHCLPLVEGLTPDQVVQELDLYNSTRPLAYRFIRSLKTWFENMEKANNE